MEILVAGLVGAVTGVLTVVRYVVRYRKKWQNERKARMENLPPDLELATSEQLFKELRNRRVCYVLLMPVTGDEGCQGLTVESNGIEPVVATTMLSMAASLSYKELKRQGVKFPGEEDRK